jgi:hypothetical protein
LAKRRIAATDFVERDRVGLVRGEPFVAGIIFQTGGVKDDFAGQDFF